MRQFPCQLKQTAPLSHSIVEVAVLAMGRRPLLGTALLENKRLCADFTEQGNVSIKPIS